MSVTIKLLNRKNEPKNGFPIYVYHSKTRKHIPTGLKCKSEYWDFKLNQPKLTHPNYNEFYSDILILSQKLLKVKSDWSINKIENLIHSNGQSESFTNFYSNLISEHKDSGFKKWKVYNDAFTQLDRYKSNIHFSDINYSFLIAFRNHKLKNGCSNNGINVYLRTIRATYNEAIKRDVFEPKSYKNPFKGVMMPEIKTKDKSFSIQEMKKLNQNTPAKIKFYSGEYHYDNYCWLCFLLGGIDLVDLVNLRWDLHVKKGRLNFERFKGGTNEIIDNMIPKEAECILKQYSDSYPYLINANEKNYENLRHNYIVRFRKYLKSIGIESYFSSKTPRYTFSSIGKELGLNRLTIMEIMGHSIGDTHSIYEGKYHNKMKDEVHRKIISSVKIKRRI